MMTVALIGPDGAGKTTVSRRVVSSVDLPLRYLYMGVNLEASGLMLPTTRLILAIKRRRGERADMTAASSGREDGHRRGSMLGGVRSGARTANWIAEEAFRQLVASWHRLRGRIVLYDRLFLADYYAHDVVEVDARRPLASRIHGFFLRHVYARPELVILLDAPAEVLHARKPDSSIEYLEQRRKDYLEVRGAVRRFEVVDATQPLDVVIEQVTALIRDEYKVRRARGR